MVKICNGGINTDNKPRLRINIPRTLVREHELNCGDEVEITIKKIASAEPRPTQEQIAKPLPVTPALKEAVEKEIAPPNPDEIELDESEQDCLNKLKDAYEKEDKYGAKMLFHQARTEFGEERIRLILIKGGLINK